MKQQVREFREASEEELKRLLEDERSALYNMRVDAKTGQMEKTADIRKAKHKIARILTEMNSRKNAKLNPSQV